MKKKVKSKLQKEELITDVSMRDVFLDNTKEYGKYVIQNRALSDVRDGLKPVTRRLIYGFKFSKLSSKTPHKKSAKLIGDVMGNFHPHGN